MTDDANAALADDLLAPTTPPYAGLSDSYERRALASLYVDRSKRQRRVMFTDSGVFINTDGLLESIRAKGVLSPILVTRAGEVVFGERRFTASKVLGLPDIPVRYVEEIDPLELRIIELEENIRRSGLEWRDEVRAVADLHASYATRRSEEHGGDLHPWTMKDTARTLQWDETEISRYLRVNEAWTHPHDASRIEGAANARQAYNTLTRMDERRSAEVMEDIIAGVGEVVAGVGTGVSTPTRGAQNAPPPAVGHAPGTPPPVPAPLTAPPVPPPPILCADFTLWAPTYAGQRFNLIHCDFPYGIDAFGGPNMHRGAARKATYQGRHFEGTYDDSEDTYVALIETLCANLDRLMAHSGHLMFWLSADLDIMYETKQRFAKLAPDLLFWPKPLIWHKTDNLGVLADPKRTPRHVYEACLVAVREDRPLVRAVSDAYGAPSDKRLHPSCKPEPVLRHFLSMFVDEHCRLLDPTAGSGSSLRAAESLGAESVVGLEVDPEHAKNANVAMRQFRALRSATL
jgi:hypothetical protein